MKKLPDEGVNRPCDVPIFLGDLEAGDTWSFHAPCTLTFLRIDKDEEGEDVLVFEVSDVKFPDPDFDSNNPSK